MFYVYLIRNKINGKVYVGKSHNVQDRWKEHQKVSLAGPNNRSFSVLHKAIIKYGAVNFEIEILETLDSEEESLKRESYWIHIHKSNIHIYGNKFGYNLTSGAKVCLDTNILRTLNAKCRRIKISSKFQRKQC